MPRDSRRERDEPKPGLVPGYEQKNHRVQMKEAKKGKGRRMKNYKREAHRRSMLMGGCLREVRHPE